MSRATGRLPAAPSSNPATASLIALATIPRTTDSGLAPIATRMPISRVRSVTEWAITLYSPMEASRIASKANPPRSVAAARCGPSDRSNASRPVPTSSKGTPGATASHCRRMGANNSSALPRVRTARYSPGSLLCSMDR